MAQLKETKIYGGLDVYSAYSGNNDEIQWLKLARNDTGDIELNIRANTNIFNPLRVESKLDVVNDNNLMMSVDSSSIYLQNYTILNMIGVNTKINIKSSGQFTINDSYNDTEICHYNSSEIVFNSFENIKDSNNNKLSKYINETVKDNGIYASLQAGAEVNFYILGTAEKNSTYGIPVKLSSVYIAGDGQLNAGSFKGANFYATSDERLKENIELSNLNFMDILNKFKIKEYNFKDDTNKQKNVGIIAQDLLKIIPEDLQKFYLTQDSKGFYSVNDSKLVYLLIGALQQEHKKNLELESRLNKLEKMFNER